LSAPLKRRSKVPAVKHVLATVLLASLLAAIVGRSASARLNIGEGPRYLRRRVGLLLWTTTMGEPWR
jgi:hypothetical protein